MGLYEDNVPHNYICYYCRHTAGTTLTVCVCVCVYVMITET